MDYKDKIAFLASHISYMENNEISEKIEIIILPMIYKDKGLFLWCYISYMEYNVYNHK